MPEVQEAQKGIPFEPRRGPYLIYPYVASQGNEAQQGLVNLYNRIVSEGLLPVVFHEKPDTTLLDFLAFVSSPMTHLQVLCICAPEGNDIIDIAGMAWLADMHSCAGILTKGVGSFLFFKDYQKPAYTDPFRDIIFEFWFDRLKLDTLVGLTPEFNRAASIFAKRLGMKEICRIPNYTTFDGKVCAAVISHLTRDEFKARRVQ